MPAIFHIDVQRGVVFSKANGVFSHTDALEHMERLSRHPDFRPAFNQLLDFRQVTSVVLSGEEVRALAQRAIFSESSRRAFVVSSDLQFGLSRMFGIYRELGGEEGIMVFREMNTALGWLGLSAEPDPKLFADVGSPPDEA